MITYAAKVRQTRKAALVSRIAEKRRLLEWAENNGFQSRKKIKTELLALLSELHEVEDKIRAYDG